MIKMVCAFKHTYRIVSLTILTVFIASCGGDDNPLPPPTVVPVKCSMDTKVTLSYEEQRLPNKLASSDAISFSQQILVASGFDKFGSEFASKLCKNGISGATTVMEAKMLVVSSGIQLWQAALDRVQGRIITGSLPASDDRMLYWARLTMTSALRQWKPELGLTEAQRADLIDQLERASRGQLSLDFPEDKNIKRILISGFDPFALGEAGLDGDLNIRIGNPSGAIALALNGKSIKLSNGSTAIIKTYLLPVNYGPFIAGQQEDTIGPFMTPGTKRVDASITISQGRSDFDLELYNGRFHYAQVPGNDNKEPKCLVKDVAYAAQLDCDIYPPQRWLGYDPRTWKRDSPAQFTESTLPFTQIINAATGTHIINPVTGKIGGWTVSRNDSYSTDFCTSTAAAAGKAKDAAIAASNAAFKKYSSTLSDEDLFAWGAAQAVSINTPPANPFETNCAVQGSGGNYLSNASAYRNTLLRDFYGLAIPAGHIHVPEMTVFGRGSDSKITDSTFESYRDAIVAQTSKIIDVIAASLRN